MKFLAMAMLTGVFVGWLVWSGKGSEVATALAALPVSTLGLLFAGLLFSYVLRALRVLHEFGEQTRGRFFGCLKLVLTHNALVNLLPMRSGELAFPLLLQRDFGVPVARAAGSLLWLRVQDAFVLAGLALAGWPGLGVGLRAAGLLLLVAGGLAMSPLAQWLLVRTGSGGKLAMIAAALADAARHARVGWLWTLANWTVKLLVLSVVLARLLGTGIDAALAGAVGGELSALLPVQGVAAVGSYEAGVAAALATAGVPFAAGLQAAFSLHLLALASALAAAAAAAAVPGARAATHKTSSNTPKQQS
ncbi:MAG: lysylphosphatidylglycerol synthase domain-containing protein [Burkholderiaceae bacterium]|nr:lysylphosphatidylglycerol synthase domain-containing protein [Burkholderiaceae bacterium]